MSTREKGSNPLLRRVIAYGVSSAVLGGLVYGGFFHSVDPDVYTMLGSVDVQLRLASVMPAADKDGKPLAAREDLLAQARDYLQRIDRQQPRMAQADEYRAFLSYLEGDYRKAAGIYAGIRGYEDCSPELRDASVINQARMLRMAGQPEEACAVLTKHEGELQPESAEKARKELEAAARTSESAAEPGGGKPTDSKSPPAAAAPGN